MDSMIGEKLNQYTFKSILGEGGMATVYLAYDENFKREVAIKLLKRQFVYNDNIRKRFLAEARNMNRMSHKNVVKVLDLIDAGDIVAFVMEFIDGETLKQKVDGEGAISTEGLKQLFPQMLEGVGYVHDQGIIHRDIKPSNFMITKDGVVKLTDFGIAKSNDQDASEYTMTGTTQQMGTPLYMSPEQVQSTRDVTKETDIYSLGVVLWYMITGKKPYDDKTISFFDLMTKIVKEKLPDASHFIPTLSTDLNAIIEKATEKNPSNRFSSCEQFQAVFDNPEIFEKKVVSDQERVIVKKLAENDVKTKVLYLDLPNGIIFLAAFSILIGLASFAVENSCVTVFIAFSLSVVSTILSSRLGKRIDNDPEFEIHRSRFKIGRILGIVSLVIAISSFFVCRWGSELNDENEYYISEFEDSVVIESDIIDAIDSDGDGVPDIEDKCPDSKGTLLTQGCPDRDSDGIIDINDNCPEVKGTYTNNGCPELKNKSYSVYKTLDKSDGSSGHKTIITKIELNSEYTILSFEHEYYNPGNSSWLNLYRSAYIKDRNSGDKYKLIKAIGITYDPEKTIIKSGEQIKFKLYFPRISDNCDAIDFIEGASSNWNTYNIKLRNSYESSSSSSNKSENIQSTSNKTSINSERTLTGKEASSKKRDIEIVRIGSLEVMTKDVAYGWEKAKETSWYDARRTLAELGDGWRLPTMYELNILYKNKDKIGGFQFGAYWSSDEGINNAAWKKFFGNGNEFWNSKSDGGYVRAVRTH